MKKSIQLVLILLLLTACGNDSPKSNNTEENNEYVAFRNIDIVTINDEVNITGEVKTWNGTFYYYVLAGEETIIDEEKEDNLHKNEWTSFTLSISKSEILALTDEIPHIALYGKNSEGETIDPNYVPIDLRDVEEE